MDPTTASYFRAILFVDSTDTRPLPPTLVQLYGWSIKRHHALGLGGTISKAIAFTIAITWLSSTREGRAFSRENTTLGDLFGEDLETDLAEDLDETEVSATEISAEEWDSLPVGSDVIVTMHDKTTKEAKFVGVRGKWVDVRVNGEVKHFQKPKVKIPAGV